MAPHPNNGRVFAFETTLSGHTYLRRIDRWRVDGYTVKLVFLALSSPEEAIARASRHGCAMGDMTSR